MNEEFDGTYGTPNKTAYNNINDYNQIFVDTVRQTGGNNNRRWLLILVGIQTLIIRQTIMALCCQRISIYRLILASGEKRIMISVHYYDPWDF